MILDLDVGNTRVKWKIVSAEGKLVDRGACSAGTDEWLATASRLGAQRIRVSSVAGAQERERIASICMAELTIEAEFARSKPFDCGVRNGYEDPGRLGVDRWLAVIAGFRQSGGKPCCVADCGSAITVDYVSTDGCHQGGVIAPGLRLMRKALLNETREISVRGSADAQEPLAPLGRNTETAVDLGLKFMEAGLIEIALRRYELLFHEEAVLILTGGDAPLVQALIGRELRLVPDLVMDGLALVLP